MQKTVEASIHASEVKAKKAIVGATFTEHN